MEEDIILEEGDLCPSCGEGVLEIQRVGDCSCHISPPCVVCVEAPLICQFCGDAYDRNR